MTLRPRSIALALLAASLGLSAGGAGAQTPGYGQPGYGAQPGYNSQPGYNGQPGYGGPDAGPAVQPKPRGGCLKYGAAGAVGGHFAHHHAVLGAMGGCVVGAYVKHRSKRNIRETGQP